MKRGPEFDSEVARRANLDFEYARLSRRLEEERREEREGPWIRSGDRNIVRQDRIPRARPLPWHPGDDDPFRG